MIDHMSYTTIDPRGRELREQRLFDLTVYSEDIHRYIGGRLAAHWHPELEVFLLMEGTVEVEAEEKVCRLTAGEGCFVNSGVLHAFTAQPGSRCLYHSFVFDPGIVAGEPGSVFHSRYVQPLLENGPAFLRFEKEERKFQDAFDKVFCSCGEEGPGYEFRARDGLSQILLEVQMREAAAPRKLAAAQEARVKEVLAWLHENLGQEITLGDIAETAHVCPRECQRIFAQYLHCSPMEYLRRRRILEAAQQLASTDQPVTEIALSCGFSSTSYFSKTFRKVVGDSPREYRDRIRREQSG